MADYYPLLSRAVQALSINTPASRKAVFDRAREALTTQLSSMNSVRDQDLERERLSLEEAIHRIESEANESGERAQSSTLVEPETKVSEKEQEKAPVLENEVENPQEIPEDFFEDNQTDKNVEEEVAVEEPVVEEEPVSEEVSELNSIEDVQLVEDTDHLNEAKSEFVEQVAALEELRDLGDESQNSVDYNSTVEPQSVFEAAVAPQVELKHDLMLDHGPRIDPDEVLNIPEIMGEDVFAPKQSDAKKKLYMKVAAVAGAIILAVVATLALVVRDKPLTLVKTEESNVSSQGASKVVDRLNEDSKNANAGAQNSKTPSMSKSDVVGVSQRAILYEEAPDSPDKGKVFVGQVVWRLETQNSNGQQGPESVVRADVEIPDRKMKLAFLIRRNKDQALPASHTLEMQFSLPPDFPHAGIANVPGVLTKANEAVRGAPLAGLSVRITNGYFLVGLANSANERSVNERQLKEHAWFDIPVLYNNGRRALLTIEKGASGEKILNQAFETWAE